MLCFSVVPSSSDKPVNVRRSTILVDGMPVRFLSYDPFSETGVALFDGNKVVFENKNGRFVGLPIRRLLLNEELRWATTTFLPLAVQSNEQIDRGNRRPKNGKGLNLPFNKFHSVQYVN